MARFQNTHLSYSRLSRFEQCPLSYKLHYIDKREAEPGLPLRFGKMVHAVLERLLQEAVDNEQTGPLSEERALEFYREAWEAEGLTGVDVFEAGLAILRSFVRDQGIIDPHDILAIEKEFRLIVGPFTVLGFIDRIDRVDDETIEVIDYKTNHQLFTRDDLDSSLQLSLYAVAARRLWPWAKNVKLSFWMLRHGIRQQTTRTDEQLKSALLYVETLGRQTEAAENYPARLNTNCSYCDHRRHCPAYAEALQGKREFLCENLDDLEAVSREREEVAHLAKILNARKSELEGILKTHLKDKDELFLAGVRYRMFAMTSVEYPIEPTLSLLENASGFSREELLQKLGAIDKKALDELLKQLGKELDKPRITLLKAELEARAHKTRSPRFWAKKEGA